MTIDPRFGLWISIIAALVGALLLSGAELTTLFGDVSTAKLLAALGIANVAINSVNAILHVIPAAKPATKQEAAKFLLGPNVD